MRRVIGTSVVAFAFVLLGSASEAQGPSPCIGVDCPPEESPTPTTTPTPAPTPTPACLPPLCDPSTPTPTRAPTPRPTLSRVTLPPDTPAPTPTPARATPTEEPTATPPPAATPTPTPVPSSPNRGLAVLGLFGSGGMIGSAAWIWRRYLS